MVNNYFKVHQSQLLTMTDGPGTGCCCKGTEMQSGTQYGLAVG